MTLSVDIAKRFPSFDLEVKLEAGDEVFGLLGASGCGKSLTMRCISGIETPDEGKIVVNGEVFFDSAAKINLKPQQRKTALLFQNFEQLFDLVFQKLFTRMRFVQQDRRMLGTCEHDPRSACFSFV